LTSSTSSSTELYYRSRHYASTDHSNSALHPRLVINYTVPDPFKQRMDHIFGALDQSFINTGILTDYGIDLANQTLFDGRYCNLAENCFMPMQICM
jgi:hypothetical protein